MDQHCYVITFIARPVAGGGHDFLIARRRDDKYMGGTWQLISGGIERDEIAWHAALREIWEETQAQIVELYRLCTTNTFYRVDTNALCTAIPFVAIVAEDAEVKLNPENTDFRWIPRDQMPDALMWPDDRASFADACTQILDNGPAKPHLAISLQPDRLPAWLQALRGGGAS